MVIPIVIAQSFSSYIRMLSSALTTAFGRSTTSELHSEQLIYGIDYKTKESIPYFIHINQTIEIIKVQFFSKSFTFNLPKHSGPVKFK